MIYPIISNTTYIERTRTDSIIHVELKTTIRKTHTDNNSYEYDVIRKAKFKESNSIDNLKNFHLLYQAFIIDIQNSINNIIISPDLTNVYNQPIFRPVK